MINEVQIQQELVDNILKACDSGDLSTIKTLICNINLQSLYHKQNQTSRLIFKRACLSGHIDIVDELTYLSTSEKSSKPIFEEALKELIDNYQPKDYPVISYLINSPKLESNRNQSNFDLIFDWGLRKAAKDDNLIFFNNLINLNDDKKDHSYIFNIHYIFLLTHSCADNNVEIFKKIYEYRQAVDPIDVDYGFGEACFQNNTNILKYLIFEKHIERTERIEEFIRIYNCTEAEKMFETRELTQQLTHELNYNKEPSKQNKI